MKKQIGLFTAILFAVSTLMMACKAEVHTHTFAEEWSRDETNHWHAATCGHTTEVSGKAEHSFGDWKVTQEPTEEAEGSKERSCTVCGYKATEVIPKLDHTHTFAVSWTNNSTYHWHAATCEHTKEVSGKAEHTFGEWTVTKEATEEAEGFKERSCTVCGYKATEVIEKLAHTHKFATYWTSDSTNHWHAATCEHATEVSGKAKHSFGDYVSNNDATTEADGTKTRKCSVCGCEDTVTDEGSMIKGFVLIPAGTFQMGSNEDYSFIKPVHEVTITKSFYMGKYEVTQAEYEKYCSYGEKKPSSDNGDGDNYPAYYVSWYDALVYCNKRSMAEGLTPCYSISGNTDPAKWGELPTAEDDPLRDTWDAVECNWNANGYRLPTEAEWEYASRAGDNTVASLTYSGTSDVNKLGDYAWYYVNSEGASHEVGTKTPNEFGLYDMSGNVWEWCWNWYTKSYDTETEGGSDPTGTSSGLLRVFRGGSWDSNSDLCAVSFRNAYYPNRRDYNYGFRVVRASSN